MKSSTIAIVSAAAIAVAGTVVCTILANKRFKKPAKTSAIEQSSAPITVAPAAANESLQSTSIVEAPLATTNRLYKHYEKLDAFLLSEHGDESTGKTTLNALMDAKIVRPLSINGRGAAIHNLEALLHVVHHPEHYTVKEKHNGTVVYVGRYVPTNSAVILVAVDGDSFVMYCPAAGRFVTNGPLFQSLDSFGYLDLLLEKLTSDWGLTA